MMAESSAEGLLRTMPWPRRGIRPIFVVFRQTTNGYIQCAVQNRDTQVLAHALSHEAAFRCATTEWLRQRHDLSRQDSKLTLAWLERHTWN